MDLVLKLREARRMRGLTQKDVARMSGVGEKTISSFETGERIGSLKLKQLERLLSAYGLSPADFFGSTIEKNMAPWELDDTQMAIARLMDELHTLPQPLQSKLLEKFRLMVETVTDVHGDDYRAASPAGPAPAINATRDRSW
ncbi:MAG TPA: helix-turn-helix transcriptional regulator [Thermoanaerobaculia bacterium]|jgi:transcriptional regulator with XRE-family HTH domain|nr:helix-turn-helix transcriptional regulator [Thermoanaerobaculia bacterium]